MNNWKKGLALLLITALGMGLPACGGSQDSDDVAGEDWRTSGVVFDHGTITRNGEDVEVCVCVHKDGATYYYDDATQICYDEVEYPMTIEDAQSAYGGTFFDDLNDDGQSDVRMDFYFDDDSETTLVWYWDSEDGYVFQPDESSVTISESKNEPDVAYFISKGIEINAVMDAGTYLLEDGVASYHGLGDDYTVGDAYWEVTKVGDYTHDGIREIEFNAICYLPEASIPDFTTEYTSWVNGELYDYYTGMWFTAATAYQNTGRADNHYLHTVEWNGQSYDIEFFYSTNWERTGDWNNVLTKSYIVYMPEDYDGLIFAAEAQADNYRDTAKRAQLESICPEAELLNCDTIDPYSSLYFSICN